MDQQRLISAMLNTMVYNRLISPSKCQYSLLTESAVRCLRSLYERDCRRSFCEPALWLAPAVSLHPPTAAAARAHHEVSSASSKMRDCFQAPGVGAVLTTIPHVLSFEERFDIRRFSSTFSSSSPQFFFFLILSYFQISAPFCVACGWISSVVDLSMEI